MGDYGYNSNYYGREYEGLNEKGYYTHYKETPLLKESDNVEGWKDIKEVLSPID
jgi:hypothetical protein